MSDIAILTDAFQAALAGRTIVASEAPQTLVVRGTPTELAALSGQVPAVRDQARQVHRAPARPRPDRRQRHAHRAPWAGCARLEGAGRDRLVLRFGGRSGPPDRSAAWTEGAAWLPADGDAIELRHRDPTRMGKIYLVPQGVMWSRPAGTSSGWTPMTPSSTWPPGEPASSAIEAN